MKNQAAQHTDNETRRRLLEAGLKLFGLHGFEATSTRSLALEAGANLSAIPYHFGGKEGLYLAVIRHIMDLKLAEIGPSLDRVMALSADPATGREVLLSAMRRLVLTVAGAMLGSQESRSCSQVMMQEQIAPTAGFKILHQEFFGRIHAAWSALLARLTGLPPGSMELRLRALSIMGQMIIFRVGMSSLLTVLNCERLPDAYLEGIAQVCVQQAEAMVASFAPACPEVAA
jgi:AcrR family transcriptional regulator